VPVISAGSTRPTGSLESAGAAGLARRAALLLVLLGVLAPGLARAHQSSVVYLDVAPSGRAVDVTIQIANTDLYEAFGLPQDRPVTEAEARAGRDRLTAYLAARVLVENHGLPCPPERTDDSLLPKSEGFFVVQHLRYRCARTVEEAQLTYNLFFDLDPRHQGLAHVRGFAGAGPSESETVFRDKARTLSLTRQLGVLENVRDYLELGVEHIFTGYDHLAFLLGLLLIAAGRGAREGGGAGLRYVIGVVSAFTLAHSVTLIVSALGWVSLPSRLVESVIAASIGLVALDNLRGPAPRHRFLVTFAFGLLHGFGFASVLREIGLPKRGLLWSLLSFNLGVELGQLVVVAMGFPVLLLMAQRGADAQPRRPLRSVEALPALVLLGLCAVLFQRFGLPLPQVLLFVVALPAVLLLFLVPRYGYGRMVRIGGSVLLALFSLLWLIERVSGRTFFGGALG
jgi:hypothetical protein